MAELQPKQIVYVEVLDNVASLFTFMAEQFRVLNALAPNRIDLGLGRAPGSDGRTALALNPNNREYSEIFPLM